MSWGDEEKELRKPGTSSYLYRATQRTVKPLPLLFAFCGLRLLLLKFRLYALVAVLVAVADQ